MSPFNQPIPHANRDLWQSDLPLQEAAATAQADSPLLARHGETLGKAEWAEKARAANRNPPELRVYDRGGDRLDRVEFHPAYHDFLRFGMAAGYAALPWQSANGHATHAAMVYLHAQIEPATCCPMTMTYAAYPALRAAPSLHADWGPRITSRHYDPTFCPAAQKSGAMIGMAMTERQGGSDLRANLTKATRTGDSYRLDGHKWFCSAPMSDAFLTLAQAPDGLTCFLVPRWRDDGTVNGIHLLRLKDKLGNRANASAEIEYHDAEAQRVGDEGQGVRAIIQMVHHTRLDTAIAPAGLMRAALAEAVWWCAGRTAFGKTLIDQPLMRAVLADLALDAEGALALAMRVARAFDSPSVPDRAFARIAVALAKFLNNKLCPPFVAEAMEVLGGMGYTDETPMPMLYREAPLNGIWEGSGNVICLDILRSLGQPETAAALAQALDAARGADRGYDTALNDYRARWPKPPAEAEGPWFAERSAQLLTAATLLQTAPAAVSDGYVATRLGGQRGHVAGSVTGLDTEALIARILP